MRWLVWLVVCGSLTGCAAVTSRMGADSTWGHSFSSVQTAVDNGEECVVISAISAPPLLLFTIPLTLVDMGGSLVVDAVMLPVDLAITPSNPELRTPRSMFCRYNYSI